MTFREVLLAIDGLRQRDLVNEEIVRHQTYIIAISGMNGKEVGRKFNKLWPSRTKKDAPDPRKALETHYKYLEANARRIKTNS